MTNLMKDDNAIVVSQDEVHFEQQTSVTRMWYKKAQNQRLTLLLIKKALLTVDILFRTQVN